MESANHPQSRYPSEAGAQSAWYRPLQADNDLYPGFIPNIIRPCSTFNDEHTTQPGLFHLLACGHIIAVDEIDRRCGLNCHLATEWGSLLQFSDTSPAPTIQGIMLPPLSQTQLHDMLYCEVCTGIPIERYQKMRPPSSELVPSNWPALRRSLSLSRPLIAVATASPDTVVDALLCSPFLNRDHEHVDPTNAHVLRCGHEVQCATPRPCAINCALNVVHGETVCKGKSFPRDERRGDAIYCQECVMRAELIYLRYEELSHQALGEQ